MLLERPHPAKLCSQSLTSSRQLEDVLLQDHRNLIIVQLEPLVATVMDPAHVVSGGAGPALMSQHCRELVVPTVVTARICVRRKWAKEELHLHCDGGAMPPNYLYHTNRNSATT